MFINLDKVLIFDENFFKIQKLRKILEKRKFIVNKNLEI